MDPVLTAPTRSAMAAFPSPATGLAFFLAEEGRQGDFICFAGAAPSDPQQGLYVQSTVNGGFYNARIWDLLNGRAEWFGAVPNGPDCLAALQAAVLLCPVVVLDNDDYYISSTLKMNTPSRRLVGHRGRSQSRYQGTRLIVRSATADTLQLGPDTAPAGGINDFLIDVGLSSLTLTRDRAPSMSAQNVGQPTGLRSRYLLNADVEHVFAAQHAIGYYYGGVVSSRYTDCRSLRSIAGSGSVDFVQGHYLDGTLTGFAAGGNASLYLFTCSSEGGAGITGDVTGMVANGAFVDTFVRDFETSSQKKGIVVAGTGNSGSQNSNIDFILDHPVLDGCTDRGIEIASVAPGGVVSLIDAYVAVAGGSALACIHVHDGAGCVRISGGQAICFPNSEAGGDALGIYADSQVGLVVDHIAIVGSKRPIALLTCADSEITPEIDNLTINAVEGAVYLADSTRVRIAPKVTGGTAVFPSGVALAGAGNTRIQVDWTRIQDASLAGGSANRLIVNGTAITTPGSFSGGLVSGA